MVNCTCPSLCVADNVIALVLCRSLQLNSSRVFSASFQTCNTHQAASKTHVGITPVNGSLSLIGQ